MTDSRITLREKVGYSLGDVAANLVFQMMMIFQLKFYTDIFGLDGAIAGSVLLVARIAEPLSIQPLESSPTAPKPDGASTVRGCYGRRCLSACSMCWHSGIPA